MSALPFVVQLVTKIWFAAVSDWIKRKELMTSTAVTKLFNLIGFFFVFLIKNYYIFKVVLERVPALYFFHFVIVQLLI